MSTGLFADEEDGYNLEEVESIEETKFKLKVPNEEPVADDSIDGLEDLGGAEDFGADEFGGEEPANDKPFDDEPFEAGVEADEESDPKTFIQQLAGKLGQSLRAYSDEQGQPDFDLEKFAVNSVLSATHTGEMDSEDQSDIIKKVKTSGNDGGDIDVNVDVDTDADNVDVNAGDEAAPEGGDELDFGDEEVEENIDLGITPHNPDDYAVDDLKRYYDADVIRVRDGVKGKVIRFDNGQLKIKVSSGPQTGSILYASPSEIEIDDQANFNLGEGKTPSETLDVSEKKRTFVGKDKIMDKLHEATEVEPKVKPKTKPKTNPDVKPTRRQRPFRPTIQPKVEPKAGSEDGVLHEVEGSHGKIMNTKFLDDKVAILTVALDDNEVDMKFENTGEYNDKPMAYDEPWVYHYDSVDSPDGKEYTVGVEFYGHPETNLDLSGIEDDYIQEK